MYESVNTSCAPLAKMLLFSRKILKANTPTSPIVPKTLVCHFGRVSIPRVARKVLEQCISIEKALKTFFDMFSRAQAVNMKIFYRTFNELVRNSQY